MKAAGGLRAGRPLLAVAVVTGFAAADDPDHVRALRAAGEIVSLSRIVSVLRAGDPGARIVEAELEREGGTWVYEIEFLDGRHRLREARFDARTARLVQ